MSQVPNKLIKWLAFLLHGEKYTVPPFLNFVDYLNENRVSIGPELKIESFDNNIQNYVLEVARYNFGHSITIEGESLGDHFVLTEGTSIIVENTDYEIKPPFKVYPIFKDLSPTSLIAVVSLESGSGMILDTDVLKY